MFGLGHLFYPWGFLVQGLAIVHFIRRRPENYWFYVIFFLGPPGAAVYILAEVLPDLGLLRGFFQGFGRRSRINTACCAITSRSGVPLSSAWMTAPTKSRTDAMGTRMAKDCRAAARLLPIVI